MSEEEYQNMLLKQKEMRKLGNKFQQGGQELSFYGLKTKLDQNEKEEKPSCSSVEQFYNDVADGKIENLSKAIEAGFDLNTENDAGCKPIHHAVDQENMKSLEFLLDKYKDINITDQNGNTAMHYAVIMENTKIIELLLNRKADCKIPNKEGETSYDLAKKSIKEIIDKSTAV